MRSWSVADVVKKSGGECVAHVFGIQPVPEGERFMDVAKSAREFSHHMSGPKSMGKAGVFGSWVGKRRESELSDSSQPLDFAGFKEAFDDSLIG
jgi:hypothetical protein